MEILKKVDSLAGPILSCAAYFLRPRRDMVKSSPSVRILVIRPGGIGDAVLLLHSISALKKTFPDSSIVVLAEKRNASVFSLCSEVNAVLQYDNPLGLIAAIQGSYDIVIDTEQLHLLSSVVARLTRAPMSIGFATNDRKRLFTHPIPYSHNDHEIDSFMHLLEPLREIAGIEVKLPFLSIPPEVTENTKHYLLPLTGKRLISVFPGGSIAQKRWGSDKFRDTIKLLVQRGYGIILVGGKDDKLLANEIAGTLPSVLNFCGILSLAESAAVIKETLLLVSGDSGIMHIASAQGTRVLALFGPSNSIKWAPRSEQSFVITHRIACSPCSRSGYTPECKHDLECMKRITVNEVVEHALRLLEK